MGVTWAEVTCDSPSELVDQLAEFLVSLSGNGICIENLDVDTFSVETIEDSPVKSVKTYFVSDDTLTDKVAAIAEYVREHFSSHPGFVTRPPEVVYLRDEDWSNNWKKHFKTLRIGERIVIKPTWEEIDLSKDTVVIELDPGMAFGTGTHATSRLCLESLERILSAGDRHISPSPVRNVLDVGTGSGILAVAAAKMGPVPVEAIDIDPVAVDVARSNVRLNGVEDLVAVSATPLGGVEGKFSVVVANILAEELVRMAADLVARMEPGGFLILSGILIEKEPLVLSGFSRYPLKLVETTREDEWSCITYRFLPKDEG